MKKQSQGRRKKCVSEGKPSTERKANPAKRMPDLYRHLVEATTDSVYMVDTSCAYIYANPRYCARVKLSLPQMIGRHYGDLHSPEETAAFMADVEQIFQKGLSFQREYKSSRDARDFLRTFYPIKKTSGEVVAAAVIAKDITALRRTQELYGTLVQNIPISVLIIRDGIIRWTNNKACEVTGYAEHDLLDQPFESFVHPEDRPGVVDNILSLSLPQGKSPVPSEYRFLLKRGDYLWHVGTASAITYQGQKAILATQMDISAQKQTELQLRQSEDRYRTIIDTIADAYYEVDLRGNTTAFNQPYLDLYEYRAEEMQGKNYRDYVEPEKAQIAYRVFHRVFETGKPVKKMEWEIIAKSGKKKQVELSVNLIRDAGGTPIGFRGIISDVTKRREAEEIIRYQALHDPLTGLANRILFYDRMQMAFKLARRNRKMVAVVVLDVDKFKEINDSYGHLVGDEILKAIAERLSSMVRASDTIARYGGDEFTLIMPLISRKEDSEIIARKISTAFDSPFVAVDKRITVTSSIGVAVYPLDGTDSDTLLRKADNAMYRAKAMGRNTYCCHGEETEVFE